MGQVLQAGAGQIPARQAAAKAGIPMTVPAITINKVCLSGINAIAMADQLIRAGEFEIVVAGGQESMTNAPHLLTKSREGYKYGDVTMRDHMAYDGLWDAFTDQAMGALTEQANTGEQAFTREEQDAFSARVAPARREGLEGRDLRRRGRGGVDSAAEGRPDRVQVRTRASGPTRRPRHSRGLRPAFSKDGTITAGSASQISDGAAAAVVMSKAKAEELGLTWVAEIGAHGVVAGPDSTLQQQPARAIAKACEQGGHRARPTSTWSRSTRRSPPSAWPRPASSASTSRRSTSTAAPSRSATRSACPVPGSPCTWRWSCSGAAAGSAWPRSAAVAARATR